MNSVSRWLAVGVVLASAGMAAAQDRQRDVQNMRRQAIEWFKAVNVGGPYGPMVPGVARKIESAMDEGRHAYLLLPGELSKSGKAYYSLTWAGAFYAFEMTSDQARRMGMSSASMVTGSGAIRGDVRAERPLVQINALRIDQGEDLSGNPPISGRVACQRLESYLGGSLVLRFSYKTKGSTIEVTKPLRGLPPDGILRFQVDPVNGDGRSETHYGPLPAFVDICRENGSGLDRTLTVVSNTLGVLLDVREPKSALEGTQWRFGGTDTTVDFLSGGRIRYRSHFSESSGRWQQQGNSVTFDTEGNTQFEVTLDGNQMVGSWRRLKGSDAGTTSPTSLTKVF